MPHRVKVIVPIPMDDYGVANRRAQLPDHMIRPGYEVEFIAVKNGAALGDSYYDAALMDMFVIALVAVLALVQHGAASTARLCRNPRSGISIIKSMSAMQPAVAHAL